MTDTEEKTPPPADPEDLLVTTRHSLASADGELRYTARSGRIVLGEEEVTDDVYKGWKPRAQLNVTAYTLDDADVTSRPVSFIFNGGPGSASVWLHLGLLGPRRVDSGDAGALTPPPYGLLDNPETLLRRSDLVFIDPISTGHSRSVSGRKAKDFLSYAKDTEQITELIRLWCTREDRWMSPKFIIGESYGTIRGVAVAERLWTRFGMQLNGLVLISSVLNLGNQNFAHVSIDEACLLTMPTYATIAHYHGLRPGMSLEEVVEEAVSYSDRYRWALGRGDRLTPEERADVAAELGRITGLGEQYLLDCNLRPEHWRFCTQLLRHKALTVGRIDGRFTGPLSSRIAENMDADPSTDAITGPYTAAMHHYLRAELGSEQDIAYETISPEAFEAWSYAKDFDGVPVNVSDKLERLVRANPHLAVRVEFGYYDLATPFAAAQDTLAHLRLPEGAADRFEQAWFPTGHMPYLHEESRVAEANQIAEFVTAHSRRA